MHQKKFLDSHFSRPACLGLSEERNELKRSYSRHSDSSHVRARLLESSFGISESLRCKRSSQVDGYPQRPVATWRCISLRPCLCAYLPTFSRALIYRDRCICSYYTYAHRLSFYNNTLISPKQFLYASWKRNANILCAG